MISLHDILRDKLLRKAKVIVDKPKPLISLAELQISEWSKDFETLMRNRLIIGNFRYGPFNKQNRSTKQVLDAIIKRSVEYLKTGNDELLVDVANLCMKEFAVGRHPKKHFKSVDDGEHV